MKFRKHVIALAIASFTLAGQAQAADALVVEGAQLLQQGKAQEAYSLLEPQESSRAGDKDFDLLFGITALQVGQNTRAIFALERVLALDPKNVRARAEIGRAYFAVGETQAARRELSAVKATGLTDQEALAAIDGLLNAVERLENENKTVIRGYLEGTFGYDTNVNAAPGRGDIAVPAFGGVTFTLNDASKANKDWFTTFGGGVSVRAPLTKALALIGSVSGSQRLHGHQSKSQFDLQSTDANLGVAYSVEKDVYTFSAQAASLAVENDRFRDVYGWTGQWQRNLDARNQVSAFVQYGDLNYVTQPIRDAERWLVGGGYAHATREGSVGYISGYLVRENVRKADTVDHLGLHGVGVRLGGQMRYNADTLLFANLAAEKRRHNASDPTFLVHRSDEQINASLGAVYTVQKNIKVTGMFARTDQFSNIALNKYKRNVISATVRYDF
ncbi:MAG: tetratricopeptide repeat protein [Rhodocyclaceae bacterium]|nr:tetratricopeptide repeat protein [Rhodocyclaceae bacterium]